MDKKNLIIASIIVVFAILLIVIFISNNSKTTTELPESTPISDEVIYDDYINIAGKRYSGYRELDIYTIDSVPFINTYLNKYYRTNISFEGVPVTIVMVEGTIFTSSKELVQKMALSNDTKVDYIDNATYYIGNREVNLTILTPYSDSNIYILAGGIIDEEKGYFFQSVLGSKDLDNVSSTDFGDIFMFNHSRNPQSIIEFLEQIIEQKATSEWFAPFDNSVLNEDVVKNRKLNGDEFTSEL